MARPETVPPTVTLRTNVPPTKVSPGVASPGEPVGSDDGLCARHEDVRDRRGRRARPIRDRACLAGRLRRDRGRIGRAGGHRRREREGAVVRDGRGVTAVVLEADRGACREALHRAADELEAGAVDENRRDVHRPDRAGAVRHRAGLSIRLRRDRDRVSGARRQRRREREAAVADAQRVAAVVLYDDGGARRQADHGEAHGEGGGVVSPDVSGPMPVSTFVSAEASGAGESLAFASGTTTLLPSRRRPSRSRCPGCRPTRSPSRGEPERPGRARTRATQKERGQT